VVSPIPFWRGRVYLDMIARGLIEGVPNDFAGVVSRSNAGMQGLFWAISGFGEGAPAVITWIGTCQAITSR
jgi:hypothetical protein